MRLSLNLREINLANRNFLLLIIAFMGFICAIAKDLDLIPRNLGISFGYSDAGLHFLGAGGIAFLMYLISRKNILIFGKSLPLIVVAVLILSVLEETSQIFRPNRGFSFIDMAANILGILVFSLLARLAIKLKLVIR